MSEFQRTRLKHHIPEWVKDGEIYFITINTQPRGIDLLTQSKNAGAIKAAIQNYKENYKWHPTLVVLMPDHLHMLVSLNTSQFTIKQIISPWKRFLARTQEITWQEGFFEHRIRDRDSQEEKEQYLRLNPVRAKLVQNPEDWPYTWTDTDFQS
ncbi:MAG: REP-associated tyrosine transposase [Opitutaceae bacterium]